MQPSVFLSVHLCVCLFICTPPSLSFISAFYLSVSLSACLSTCPFSHLFLHSVVCLSVCSSILRLSTRQSVDPSNYLTTPSSIQIQLPAVPSVSAAHPPSKCLLCLRSSYFCLFVCLFSFIYILAYSSIPPSLQLPVLLLSHQFIHRPPGSSFSPIAVFAFMCISIHPSIHLSIPLPFLPSM